MTHFVDELRAELLTRENLNAEMVCEIVRQRWGGRSVYVAERHRVEIYPGDTPRMLMLRGMARSTAYVKGRKNFVDDWD